MSDDDGDATVDGMPELQSRGMDRLHDDLHSEYYRIVGIIEGFDQRLLTIKSVVGFTTGALGPI